MIIWTIQPYSVYQQLKSKGQFYCDPEKSENLKENNFQVAYNWMIKQMKRRKILPPRDVKVPLWAWYRRDYKHVRPDFRWIRDSEIEVCMEINIPEEKVLLSDFEAWHFVLSYVLTLFSDLTRKVTMQNLYHDGGFSSMGMSRRAMKLYEKGLEVEYQDIKNKI